MARIAVIEDEPELRALITQELEDEGHETLPAGDGQAGLELILAEKPDLVLSDITMPRMNGYQLLRKLQDDYPERTPFIFLSALADRHDVMKGLRIGADDYVTKPIDFEILLTRVEIRLRQGRQVAELQEIAAGRAASAVGPAGGEIQEGPPPAQASAAEFAGQIERRGGEMVAGHVQTVSLQTIRERLGDDWQRVAERVARVAETTIRRHISTKDLLRVTKDGDFVICFADHHVKPALSLLESVADEVWSTLFGELRDEALAQVDTTAETIALSPEERADQEGLFKTIVDKIKSNASERIEQEILKIYQFEDIELHKIYTMAGKASRMRLAFFDRRIADWIQRSARPGRLSDTMLATLDLLLLERVVGSLKLLDGELPMTVVRLRHLTVSNPKWLKAYLKAFEQIEEPIRRSIIFQVTHLPPAVDPQDEAIPSLPAPGRARILEIAQPEQLAGVSLEALKVGLIAIDYDRVTALRDHGLDDIIDLVRGSGSKFILQNVPEPLPADIRELGADLFLK
jgi:CheY-like chemotaxis protein